MCPAAVAPHARPCGAPHLVPGLQVPLQRLLGELADPQLAVLAGHHDAGPPEAHCHFHPGPGLPRWAGPNRCLAPGHSPSVGGRGADTKPSRACLRGPDPRPLPCSPTGGRGRERGRGDPGKRRVCRAQAEVPRAKVKLRVRPGPAQPCLWRWPWRPWQGRPQAPGWSGRRRRRARPELGGNFCAGSQLLRRAGRNGLPRPAGQPGPGS